MSSRWMGCTKSRRATTACCYGYANSSAAANNKAAANLVATCACSLAVALGSCSDSAVENHA